MTFFRRHRLLPMLFALLSLLFMQSALASYACPGTASKVAEVAAMAEAGMPCAGAMPLSMDGEQPNLCHAHCQAGQQSADKYELPYPVAIGTMPAEMALRVAVPVFSPTPVQAPHMRRSTAPPIAISHCCWRI